MFTKCMRAITLFMSFYSSLFDNKNKRFCVSVRLASLFHLTSINPTVSDLNFSLDLTFGI